MTDKFPSSQLAKVRGTRRDLRQGHDRQSLDPSAVADRRGLQFETIAADRGVQSPPVALRLQRLAVQVAWMFRSVGLLSSMEVLTIATSVAAAFAFQTMLTSSPLELGAWVIVLVAAIVSSIAGFAFAAISGAVLFQVTQDKSYALQIILIASIAIQSLSVWKLRGAVKVGELVPYFLGGLATLGPGVWLFLTTPTWIYLVSLGGFLVAYAASMLFRPSMRFCGDSIVGRLVCGALGGITGATAAFPGAFITIWCGGHGWDKVRQRAVYQPFILGMQVLTMAVLSILQPLAEMRFDLVAFGVPALLGAYIGLRIFDQLSTAQFDRVVGGFLLLSGAALCAKGALG